MNQTATKYVVFNFFFILAVFGFFYRFDIL